MIKKYWKFIALILIAMFATGCARDIAVPAGGMEVMGFWAGLWDGMTAGFAFIGSLFGADWAVYDVVNNGGWYDFGFLMGVGGSSSCACRSRRRRR